MNKSSIDPCIMLEAIKSTNEGISISDAQLPDYPLIYVNEGFEKMTGYASEEIVGKNCRFLQKGDTDQPQLKKIHEALANATNCRVLLKNYKKDGTMFWNELNMSPIKNNEGTVTHYVGIQKNVTLQEENRQKIEFLSLHDHLTGLLNRHGLDVEVDRFYAWANRSNQNIVVIMMDLNNFKKLNDTQGHQVGDSVLTSYAHALQKNFRKNDLIARIGGDEFMVLTAMDPDLSEGEINDKMTETMKSIESNQALSKHVSISFGLACSDGKPIDDLDNIMNIADKKMYEMKNKSHLK